MAWTSKSRCCWTTRSLKRSQATEQEAFAQGARAASRERPSRGGGTDRKRTRGTVMSHRKQGRETESRDHSLIVCPFL